MWKALLGRVFGNNAAHPLQAKSDGTDHPWGWQMEQILAASELEAQRMGQTSVRSEHILLALSNVKIGGAFRVLSELGVDAKAIEAQILVWGPLVEDVAIASGEEVTLILEKSKAEARFFRRKHIATEHILLALSQLEHQLAFRILQQLNITPKALREKVYELERLETTLDGPPSRTDSGKVERFTKRARHVLSLSQQIAEGRQDSNVHVEYILLALLQENGGVAWRALSELGVTVEKLEPILYAGLSPAAPHNETVNLSPDVKQTLERAVDEARRMGHHHIGTEHLLLGLVRQTELQPVKALNKLGVTPAMLRKKIFAILAEY